MSRPLPNEIDETVKFLLELVNDSDVEFGVERKIEAAFRAADLGGTGSAVAALVELADSITLSSCYAGYQGADHLKIARAIAKLGDPESAVRILVAILENDYIGLEEREAAEQEIINMSDTVAGVSAIRAVIYSAGERGSDAGFTEAEYRISASETMAAAGKIAEALTVLKVITENSRDEYDHSERWNAAVTLSNIGDNAAAAKAFLSLAVDDDLDAEDQDRLDAALKVVELGDWEMASEALLTVAEECEYEEIGLKAAIQAASFMDVGAERAIEIIGALLSRRYSYRQLMDAQMERDLAVNDQTTGLPRAAMVTDQEKAWALILEAANILYPRAFAD